MEKDYFKDRPESVQYNSKIYKGSAVFICLKKMQPYAKEISDLTLTNVTANLTSAWQHPRGQKIKGYEIETDKYGNKIYKDDYNEVVGRCTYIMDDNLWSFDTTEGKKFLKHNSKTGKLSIVPYDKLKGAMKIYCVLKHDRACFKMPLCKYMYFEKIEQAQSFIDELNIYNIYYYNDNIYMAVDENMIYEDKFEMYIDGKKIVNPREMYYYVDSVCNGKLPLELENFMLEKIL